MPDGVPQQLALLDHGGRSLAVGGASLTDDQMVAYREIMAAQAPGTRHLLEGEAGSGKTTLVKELARSWLSDRRRVVLTAPTHKAVQVLRGKVKEAGLEVDCRTIQSLLSLRPKVVADRQVFVRDKKARPVMDDVVVIDECSMLDTGLMRYIRRYLPLSYVVLVGDSAQLPPVGEDASESFATKSRSRLTTIIRQGEGNPVLNAARILRQCQLRGGMDWSWARPANAKPYGVYVPGRRLDAWMRKAFTSDAFDADPDSFRYLAWTNAQVDRVNRRIRAWRYGDPIPSPFMPGERALFRSPLVIGDSILFSTNEEATVLRIERGEFSFPFPAVEGVEEWTATLPSWRIEMRTDDGAEVEVHAPADPRAFERIQERVRDEAEVARVRWKHFHAFKGALADLRPIYALTVHSSQGSTFSRVFVDVPDIRRRLAAHPLECAQLFYVAVTRPTTAVILAGLPTT